MDSITELLEGMVTWHQMAAAVRAWWSLVTVVDLVEWTGSVLGAAGALLLASNSRRSAYGWVLFLASNAFVITFALLIGARGIVAMQVVFTFTSAIGIWRWLIQPRRVARDSGECPRIRPNQSAAAQAAVRSDERFLSGERRNASSMPSRA